MSAGACILYVNSSLHSYHDQRLKMGAKWPAFLGVSAWSDNIEGWILSHFTLARCGRTNTFAAYVLAFTGKFNIKCLNVPYKFLHWRFSSLLNSENCVHLTMQGKASTPVFTGRFDNGTQGFNFCGLAGSYAGGGGWTEEEPRSSVFPRVCHCMMAQTKVCRVAPLLFQPTTACIRR